jgi:hypothetical protein
MGFNIEQHLETVKAQIEQAKAEGRSTALIRNLQRELRALKEATGK